MSLFNRSRAVPPDIAARNSDDDSGKRRHHRTSDPLDARVLSLRDPYDYPIPSAQPFVLASGAVATAAVETLQPAGLLLALTAQEVARIDSITIYITGLLGTTNVVYSLTSGGGRPMYPALSFFPRAATAAGDNYNTYIRVPAGAKIGMDIKNVDGGSYTVGAIITGWKFTTMDADRFNEYGS